jgi:acyl dehydratase
VSASPWEEGRELPPFEVAATMERVIRYCGLSWNFPPFFYDPEAARAQGMPGPLVPGPLKLGLLYAAVEHWLQGQGWVRDVRAAHRRPDLVGTKLRIVGRVARVYAEEGRPRADLELAVLDEEGHPTVRGFASVEFGAGP